MNHLILNSGVKPLRSAKVLNSLKLFMEKCGDMEND